MEKKTVEENMSLYNRVRQVPEEAKKPFDTGRFKGTDINPMWRIKRRILGPVDWAGMLTCSTSTSRPARTVQPQHSWTSISTSR